MQPVSVWGAAATAPKGELHRVACLHVPTQHRQPLGRQQGQPALDALQPLRQWRRRLALRRRRGRGRRDGYFQVADPLLQRCQPRRLPRSRAVLVRCVHQLVGGVPVQPGAVPCAAVVARGRSAPLALVLGQAGLQLPQRRHRVRRSNRRRHGVRGRVRPLQEGLQTGLEVAGLFHQAAAVLAARCAALGQGELPPEPCHSWCEKRAGFVAGQARERPRTVSRPSSCASTSRAAATRRRNRAIGSSTRDDPGDAARGIA